MADNEKKADSEAMGNEGIPTASFGGGATGPGEQIGPYKLLRILGEGGYGIVYLAERQRPVKRRVALKVIKPGMDTKQVIARFEAERQALALLDHPNIAHVFNAGTTKAGRPYFAMEYVKGVPITEHCDRYKLTIEERLKLFLSVCEAVQHAHQKAIIHRDIKPSNILVAFEGEQAIPMIIDFGVAKALSQSLTERTLVTEQAQIVGTPEYMSPEQAEMTSQDIDTRTDVYSLGVLLYELLTGTLPFDSQTLREGGPERMRRMIREQDPKIPSVRFSTVEREKSVSLAGLRRTDIRTLERRLHGELDWIMLKAMDKDRTRRYQTGYALAEDIQRYLNQEPVLAGPPSATYKLRKFVTRNKGLFISMAAVAAVVILATIISIVMAIKAKKAQHIAEEATKSEVSQRQKAEQAQNAAETLARQQEEDLYFNHITLAHQELKANRPVHALDLLDKCPGHLRNWEWFYLQRKSHFQETPPLEFDARVISIAFSPNGLKLAVFCGNGTLVVRDRVTGIESAYPIQTVTKQFELDSKWGFRQWVAFCPDSEHVAVVGDDHVVDLISLTSGKVVQRFTGHTDTLKRIACSSDGHLLATSSFDCTVRLWDLLVGSPLRVLKFDCCQTSLAFTADGKRLIVGGGGYTESFIVGNLLKAQETQGVSRFIGYETREIAVSPDGQRIATGLWDDTILMCNGEYDELMNLRGHIDGVCGVAFNADGTRLASISDDLTARLWDAKTGREILVLEQFDPFLYNIAFSKDGHELVVGDRTNSLKVFDASPLVETDTRPPIILRGHTETIYSINYSPSGHQLISSGHDGIARIWNTLNGQQVTTIDMGREDCANAQFSPNGQWIVAMGILEGRWAVKVMEANPPYQERFTSEFDRETTGVTFSHDSQYLIVGGMDETLTVFDWQSKTKVVELGRQDDYPISIIVSPDGKHLASVGYGGSVMVWDATRLNKQQAGRIVYNSCISHFRADFSPDGKSLAVGGRKGELKILNVASGETLLEIPNAHGEKVSCVSFAPNGKYLASCSSDKTVRIWDIQTRRQLDILLGHEGRLLSVAFSPDGKHVASVGYDKMVRIWTPRLE